MLIRYLIILAAGYLLGSCNGALVMSKLVLKEDVRSHGSGNAGLTNFLRSYGGALTFAVSAVDILKAVAACGIGWLLTGAPGGAMLGGVAAVAGHMYPVFFQFKGGKGILTGAFVALCVDWRIFVAVIAVFVIVVALTRYVSLGSVLAAAVYPLLFLWLYWGDWLTVLCAFLIAGGAIARHHANISRLVHGTERKLSFHKKQ